MTRRRIYRRHSNFGGRMDMNNMPAGQYLMGLVGVGILFFVIGYGLEAGKETA